jgi:UDP-N-acetyl-2-amino-2-deoxyglucuronate dehydrogenase
VQLTYISARGPWYDVSWKGVDERSGGVATNIGIHFFDLLLWLFGPVQRCEVHLREPRKLAGFLELQNADVRWFLSVNSQDLPFPALPGKKTTYRSITIAGQEIEFTESFGELHTAVYRDILAGAGTGIEEARPSIELVHSIRTAALTAAESDRAHPFMNRGSTA